MREHAIPQDVTGYRFHIIGNMTLKQFAEVAAGCVVGFLIYTTNLITIIKWPLIGLSVGIGALIAFIPIEERPLDHWVSTFIKVLYKPTKFFWRREPKVPEPFLFEPNMQTTQTEDEVDLGPAKRQRIKEYLSSVKPPEQLNQFDLTELQEIDTIIKTFDQVNVPMVATPQQDFSPRPQLKVRPRSFVSPAETTNVISFNPQPALNMAIISNSVIQDRPQDYSDDSSNKYDTTHLESSEVARELYIPEVPMVTVATPNKPRDKAEVVLPQPAFTENERAYVTDTVPVNAINGNQQAITNTKLPFPDLPKIPNVVVGMVLTPSSDLINDAIVEIQSQNGQVARAVKTNSLGQFAITTPLDNGTYTMLVEKDGYQFVPLRLDVTGKLMSPVEIRSVA